MSSEHLTRANPGDLGLFGEPGLHPWFESLRTDAQFSAHRQLCERLELEFAPFADTGFRQKCRTAEFQARYWEMYCGAFLIRSGLPIRCREELRAPRGIDPLHCPDHFLSIETGVWVESTTVTKGMAADLDSGPSFKVRDVPDIPMMVRIMGAIRSKALQIQEYRRERICREHEPVIVAVNTGSIECVSDFDPPRIVRSLYGLGMPVITVDPSTGRQIGSGIQSRPAVMKGGSPIATDIFLHPNPIDGVDYTGIAGVLYSSATPFNGFPFSIDQSALTVEDALPLGTDFVLVHNKYARPGLAVGVIPAAREYWIDDANKLRSRIGAR